MALLCITCVPRFILERASHTFITHQMSRLAGNVPSAYFKSAFKSAKPANTIGCFKYAYKSEPGSYLVSIYCANPQYLLTWGTNSSRISQDKLRQGEISWVIVPHAPAPPLGHHASNLLGGHICGLTILPLLPSSSPSFFSHFVASFSCFPFVSSRSYLNNPFPIQAYPFEPLPCSL